MMTAKLILALAVLFIVLWVAYRIGAVILRIVVGLLFLGLTGYAVWRFLLR